MQVGARLCRLDEKQDVAWQTSGMESPEMLKWPYARGEISSLLAELSRGLRKHIFYGNLRSLDESPPLNMGFYHH